MKVKLLKKIRKRYEIVKVIKNDNPNCYFYGKQTPFYELVDNHERRYPQLYDIYEEALDRLVEVIRDDYYHTKKNIGFKSEVMWYPKQHK